MNKKYTYLIIVLLVIACLATYGRILGIDFVNYDDNKLITERNKSLFLSSMLSFNP